MRYLIMIFSTFFVMILTGSHAFAQYPAAEDTAQAQTEEQAPAPTEPAQQAEEPAATPSEPAAAPAEEPAPTEPAQQAEEPAPTPSEPAAAPAEEPAPAAEQAETAPPAPALTAAELDGLSVVDSAGQELGKVVGVNEADGKVASVEVKSAGILGSGFFATTYVLPIDKVSKNGDKLSASVTGKEAAEFTKK